MVCDCGTRFDPRGAAKRRAGGRVDQCPDCAIETAPARLNYGCASGKAAEVCIVEVPREQAQALRNQIARSTGVTAGYGSQRMMRATVTIPHRVIGVSGGGGDAKCRK